MQLSSKTQKCLAALFNASELAQANDILVSLPDYAESERLQLAAVRFSSGTLERLQIAIDLATTDPRDLLMASGFGELGSHEVWEPQPVDEAVFNEWQAGSLPVGVAFGPNQRVKKIGRRRAKEGVVISLVHLEPQPCYRVNLDATGEREIWQNELEAI